MEKGLVADKKGKVTLSIQLDASDAKRLVDALKAGTLADLGVVDITFPNNPELNPRSSEEGHARTHRSTNKSESPHR